MPWANPLLARPSKTVAKTTMAVVSLRKETSEVIDLGVSEADELVADVFIGVGFGVSAVWFVWPV